MQTITKQQFLEKKEFFLNEIISGKIFIYPTDTIYGIGCNATLSKSIQKIREIKQRDKKPMSIIAPSKDWIQTNCNLASKEIEALPGPYTLIVKLKNKNSIAKEELIGSLEGLGLRIPDNWFSEIISETNIPFVTTSVNISGEPHLTNPKDLKESISKKVDYLVEDGILSGNPSTIINLIENKTISR